VPDILPDGSQGPADRTRSDQANTDAAPSKGAFTPERVRSLYESALKFQRKSNQDYWLNHAFLEGTSGSGSTP
jgi:hypothetical protein